MLPLPLPLLTLLLMPLLLPLLLCQTIAAWITSPSARFLPVQEAMMMNL
jgi:hypothetical protein